MGHHRVILPQSVLVVSFPVLLAVGVQLPHPLDLAGVLRQVGLDVQLPLPGQLPQRRHKLVGTAGREPRRDDGPDVFKMTPVQPPHRLADGLLRGFLQHPGQAIAIHVHLAYIAGDAGPLQLIHQDPRGLRVKGREHAHPRGAAGDEVSGQPPVHPAGVVRVGEPRLRGKRVGVQPVQQLQVHPHAQHGILRRVEVHVHEGLHQQPVAVVSQLCPLQLPGQIGTDRLYHAVLQHQAAVLQDGQLPHLRGVNDVSAQHLCHDSYLP